MKTEAASGRMLATEVISDQEKRLWLLTALTAIMVAATLFIAISKGDRGNDV